MKKVALVTGSSSQLGQEIARLLNLNGYVVYGGFSHLPNHSPSFLHPLDLDLTKDSKVNAAVNHIRSHHKRLDVLINLAGLTLIGPTTNFNSSDYSHLLDVNVTGPFRVTKATLPLLEKSQGIVVNISSLSSFFASPNFGLYSASKHALHAWGIVAALELKKRGVRVVNLAPGAIKSDAPLKFSSHLPARKAIPFLGLLLPLVSVQGVANSVISAINHTPPYPLVLVGRDSYLLYYLQKFLPASVLFNLQSWLWQRQT